MLKKRLFYLLATIAIIGIEVLIALFVNDAFIRPYIGDVIVVFAVYTFARIFIPDGLVLMPVYVFIFACFVEILQYVHILDRFGLQDNRFLSILVGGTFDFKDLVCYFVGCMILSMFEFTLFFSRQDDDLIEC